MPEKSEPEFLIRLEITAHCHKCYLMVLPSLINSGTLKVINLYFKI